MDWSALILSLKLAACTVLVLLPLGVVVARQLAWRRVRGKGLLEALVALPLVLPPTVLGYYLLTTFERDAPVGWLYEVVFSAPLAFSFAGLLIASVIFNLPFAIQPVQRAFEALPAYVREAAWCSGLSHWRTFWRVELPLAWPGILTAIVLTFAHTMGEFGVVLMVGGNIPEETKTMSIAIYERVQVFDDHGAAIMSAVLLAVSFTTIGIVYLVNERFRRRTG